MPLLLVFSCSVMSDSLQPHGLQHTRLPILHHLPELAQTHVHWITSNLLIFCHPLRLLPSVFPASGLFLWVSSSHQVAKVLELRLQHQSFMNIQDGFPLELTGLISLQSKGLSRVFSNTTVQKHQFFSLNILYGPALTSIHDYWKNRNFDYTDLCWQSNVSAF